MAIPLIRDRYDVVVAGARCAGASTAMLLARRGFRVLVVDPARPGSDTLSTHALMRGAVLQLARWGLLDRLEGAGTPPMTSTTFHYGDESVRVEIKPRDGVDALYAPRRTVLDPILADAALDAGADVVHGLSVVELLGGPGDRVGGVVLAGAGGETREVRAPLVIGADGVRSRIARLLGAPVDYRAGHATASIYGYWRDLPVDGFHWYYRPGVSIGAIPTNDGETCVFVSLPDDRFRLHRGGGLQALHRAVVREVAPAMADHLDGIAMPRLRAFPGIPGFLRRSAGPGWALVGDAGYFKDPLTAHGITDALRDAELLARAVSRGGDDALLDYQATRNRLARELMDVTDRISSFAWDLAEVQELHMTLSRCMKEEVELILSWDRAPGTDGRAGVRWSEERVAS